MAKQAIRRVISPEYMVQILVPVVDRPDCKCGFYIFKSPSLEKCKDFADWHHMLTGHEYDVHLNRDPETIYHTGVYNSKFLEENFNK